MQVGAKRRERRSWAQILQAIDDHKAAVDMGFATMSSTGTAAGTNVPYYTLAKYVKKRAWVMEKVAIEAKTKVAGLLKGEGGNKRMRHFLKHFEKRLFCVRARGVVLNSRKVMIAAKKQYKKSEQAL